jgi:tRNA threonylcarbamoyladenosine biosynthesis protein TsaE
LLCCCGVIHSHVTTMLLHLPDESATRALGARLAAFIEPGCIIYLSGPLGGGKTTLVRGLLAGFGHTGAVKSPTFSLVEPYVLSRLNFYHFDLYRIKKPEEWDESGFREYFDGQSISLIEWPEKALAYLPGEDLWLTFAFSTVGRRVTIVAATERGNRCREQLQCSLPSNVSRVSS